jgi:hypothetical protein
MTREDKGHYAKKHPADRKVKQEIAEAVKQSASNGEIPCTEAFKIAGDLNVAPAEVGFTIDALEISIAKCQLGLFGYRPRSRIMRPAENVSPTLESAIRESMENGRLACKAAWNIARNLSLGKVEVVSACEKLNIKISSCQLGAF